METRKEIPVFFLSPVRAVVAAGQWPVVSTHCSRAGKTVISFFLGLSICFKISSLVCWFDLMIKLVNYRRLMVMFRQDIFCHGLFRVIRWSRLEFSYSQTNYFRYQSAREKWRFGSARHLVRTGHGNTNSQSDSFYQYNQSMTVAIWVLPRGKGTN